MKELMNRVLVTPTPYLPGGFDSELWLKCTRDPGVVHFNNKILFISVGQTDNDPAFILKQECLFTI